ncbi:unnamed protein product [Caenorhabditis angaria]|uniref:VWFA domain-containing protein n=1 Tax=Caenorhabditis angaria TaxID=860376 RepID=A0A9P1N8E8_9PELO|nr:unnamed protein product [Caenorhabditis angaria]
MRFPLLAFFILASSISAYEDRECGADLSHLWLDIVLVVDNSANMTFSELMIIGNTIKDVFMNGTKVGTQYSDPRSTRVGIVTYNLNATVAADLNTYQSTGDFIVGLFGALVTTTVTESYLKQGLLTARDTLYAGRQEVRQNYQQVIIVFTSQYGGSGEQDPKPVADRLKASGIQIITVFVDYDNNNDLRDKLSQIANPGYNFSTFDTNLVGELEGALLLMNCFCPNYWTQYTVPSNNGGLYKYGVCVRSSGIQASWNAAKFACHNYAKTGFLVSEFSQQKHDFVFNLVQKDTFNTPPYMYHIGLSRINGVWSWQQVNGQQVLPLQNETFWNPGYPTSLSSDSGVMNIQAGAELNVGWQNINLYTVAKIYILLIVLSTFLIAFSSAKYCDCPESHTCYRDRCYPRQTCKHGGAGPTDEYCGFERFCRGGYCYDMNEIYGR